MAFGTIQKAILYLANSLDQQLVASAVTGWMEQNVQKVQYNGGNSVRIAKINNLVGLGDYKRGVGYSSGSYDLSWETLTMTQDRSRQFNIDNMDNDETAFVLTVTNLMGEFQRRFVVPEIDSYRLSSLYKRVHEMGNFRTYTPSASDIWDALTEDIATVQDLVGETVPLIIHMRYDVARILDLADKITHFLETSDFPQGGVNFKVRTLENIPIIRTPSIRMYTNYTFDPGNTPTTGGFSVASGADQINWIIVPQQGPIAISKTDRMKTFDPDTNQSADGWLIQYRKYHDCWIEDNQIRAAFANIAPTTVVVPEVVSSSPANGDLGVATSAAIVFTFNENILEGALTLPVGVVLQDAATGSSVPFTAAIGTSENANKLTITPTSALSAGSTYVASIAPGTVKDASNNVNETSYSISFSC